MSILPKANDGFWIDHEAFKTAFVQGRDAAQCRLKSRRIRSGAAVVEGDAKCQINTPLSILPIAFTQPLQRAACHAQTKVRLAGSPTNQLI